MKNYSLDLLPGEPLVVCQGFSEYSWKADFVPMADEVAALLNELDQPVFLIIDMTAMAADLADVIFSTNYAARSTNQFLHHPNMREFLAITTNKLISMAVQGMNTPTFGNVPVQIFSTLDDAMRYARSQ